MRHALISASLIITLVVTLLLLLANFVYAETTFNDNPDEFVIYPPISAPASVQQTETGGHGGRAADTTAPPAANCTQNWVCGDWSSCASGFQTRACADSSDCDNRYKKGNVSKLIAAQKPAESRDCKEIVLPKAETPTQLTEAPTPKKQTAPPICSNATVKLAISPIASAIALLALIAIIVVKYCLRRKGDYIIVYLHRDKQQNNKYYIKKGYGNNFQSDKIYSNKVHGNNFQSNKRQSKK